MVGPRQTVTGLMDLGPSLLHLLGLSREGTHFLGHNFFRDNGNAVVVWRLFDGTNQRIQAVRRSPAGALSVVQTLSDAGHDADAPQLSVDRNGNAIVAWRLFDGTNQRIQAGRRSAGGALSPVLTVSDGGQDATDPEVGADPNGNAVVVWMRSDGAHNRVQAGRLQAG